MATITERPLKNGTISYQIQVFRGRDANGKKRKPYSMTWKPPENWKSKVKIEKELQRVAAQFELECKNGEVEVLETSFANYAEHCMELKERDDKHKTVFRYRQLLERINAAIGKTPINKVTTEQLNRFYLKLGEDGQNKITGKGLSEQTILHHHRLIHDIFSQAIREGVCKTNPATSATPPKKPKKEAEHYEIEQIMEIMSCLKQEPLKWQCVLMIAIETGARRGEIFGIRWNCIDIYEHTIKIQEAVLYTPQRGVYLDSTKTRKKRTVSVSDELIHLLQRYRREKFSIYNELQLDFPDDSLCFTQEGSLLPMHPDTMNTWLSRFAQRNDLPHIHPHGFRHTQASILYAQGVDPITISKRLGHEQVSTTQNIYAHLMDQSDAKAQSAVAEILYPDAIKNA